MISCHQSCLSFFILFYFWVSQSYWISIFSSFSMKSSQHHIWTYSVLKPLKLGHTKIYCSGVHCCLWRQVQCWSRHHMSHQGLYLKLTKKKIPTFSISQHILNNWMGPLPMTRKNTCCHSPQNMTIAAYHWQVLTYSTCVSSVMNDPIEPDHKTQDGCLVRLWNGCESFFFSARLSFFY